MTDQTLPYANFEETVKRFGLKATIRVEKVLQASMPEGYRASALGKYQITTTYQSATDPEAELSELQEQRGRTLGNQLQARLEKQMRREGWSEALTFDGSQFLQAKNGSKLWEYHGPPPQLRTGEQLVSRRMKKRAVTFTCTVCGETVTQQRYPSHLPKYCSDTCKESDTREKTRERVAAWRKTHPDARSKLDVTGS